MNYNCIDPYILPTIKLLNQKGIETYHCCSGVGISKSYEGKTVSTRHKTKHLPYVFLGNEDPQLYHNLQEMIKPFKLPEPPESFNTVFGNEPLFQLTDITEFRRENVLGGENLPITYDITIPFNVFDNISNIANVMSNSDFPKEQKSIFRNYVYRCKLKWLNTLHKIVKEIS